MNLGRVLALDLSSRTGWTLGALGARTSGGVWKLPPADCHGKQMNDFMETLCDSLDVMKPDQVVMEAPLLATQQTHQNTAMQQMGLYSHTASMCARYGLPCFKANVSTLRSKIFGSARVPGRNDAEKKLWIVRWCRQNGAPEIEDHNHADSFVLWLYAQRFPDALDRVW